MRIFNVADKVHKTKGIVLRATRYGETSLVIAILTELFGVQSYLVNGVRQASAKGSNKASYFQPGAILELVVYHNELKQLQRIKEYRWSHIYQQIFTDVPTHSIVLFMVELLTKCLKQPEENADLFNFAEDALLHLDSCNEQAKANYPLFFALHLPVFFGIPPRNATPGLLESASIYFDLREGSFALEMPSHTFFLEGEDARAVAELLNARHPDELSHIQLRPSIRHRLLLAMADYYPLHIQDFGILRTLPVLREIMR
ncbi:DNA repair protein RecO [Terrimonas ferruginea]|uniref:DNA repair protein RecO n=1 Tax=Terrimonas ferruginea TaxID=249 RepID=UPI000AEF8823|nr:DNA repair protein RecO [Terrimonas ferruginea]